MDAFVVVTAVVHNLTLVSRNAGHFRLSVKAVFDPWEALT